MEFKEGIYQRLTAGEWLAYHFASDISSIWGEGIWSDVMFFTGKHAARLTEFIVSLGVSPLPPGLWHIYSPAPPKRWYDSLKDKDIAFAEMYEIVIGMSEFYMRMKNRYGFNEEFLDRHLADWQDVKRRMRNLMGR